MHPKLSIPSAGVVLAIVALAAMAAEPLRFPDPERYTREAARRMARAAEGRLAPVYAPLAEQIVEDFGLREVEGIGIDLGSGPGDLVVELCRRTRLHWVNADINPHFFPIFLEKIERAGLAGRASAVFADAQALPFRDGWARVIVSRGSIPFWDDWKLALGEIHRVLAPGGVAFIGRGLPRDLPIEVARKVREGGSGPPYEPEEMERKLRAVLGEIGVRDYRIHRPRPAGGEGIRFGVWLEIHKADPTEVKDP